MIDSEVVRAARGFRAAILADDATQMAHLADRYLQIELGLEDIITALSERIAAMEDEGRATYWQIQKLDTYQRLQLRLAYELDNYNAWVTANVREEQLRFAGLGTDHAASLLNVQKAGTAVPLTSAERDRIMAMIGYAGDGSPLDVLLAKSGDIVRNAVTRELFQAVSRSQNPRLTARAIRKATGMALNRAMAIARTEQLRVYRTATLASYRAAGVQLYQRISARDANVCIACLSMDGEISTTSDASVDDHVAGHCSSIPYLGSGQSEMEPSEEWFNRQSEDMQRTIMGTPGRYDMYRSGKVGWQDLGRHTHDPIWGGSIQPVPVKELAVAQTAAA